MLKKVQELSILSYPLPCHQSSTKQISGEHEQGSVEADEKHRKNAIECPKRIHCQLPKGLKVKNHPTTDGKDYWGLYASESFQKHSVIYVRDFAGYVFDQDIDYELIIDPDGIVIPLNTVRHMVRCGKGIRTLITFGSLTNHSCNPNAYSDRTYPGLMGHQETAIVALRDIHPGEEITLDYNLAIYSMKKPIDPCLCNMSLCRKSCKGFKYLSETEQRLLLPYAKYNVQMAYWEEHSPEYSERKLVL